MFRPLTITPATKDAVEKVVSFAAKEANWYHPLRDDPPPGEDPRYCVNLDTYRCVFSITRTPDGTYRHLSVSVPAKGKLPNPTAFNEIAKLFGFPDMSTKSYQIAIHEVDNCIVAAYPLMN